MARISFATGDESYLYCEPADVARFFEQYDDFDDSTNPTSSDVEELIWEQMEYIDRQTGHAWRPNTVVDEVRDLVNRYYWWAGVPVPLSKRDVREFDPDEGDKLEVWEGGYWDDWAESKTYGREEDYWMDKTSGILWLRDRYIFRRHPRMRLTYRYGNPDGATRSIRQATAKLVAADLLASDRYSMNVPGTDGNIGEQSMMEKWQEDAQAIIDERNEVAYVEPY